MAEKFILMVDGKPIAEVGPGFELEPTDSHWEKWINELPEEKIIEVNGLFGDSAIFTAYQKLEDRIYFANCRGDKLTLELKDGQIIGTFKPIDKI